jgi:hypothetical protein
VNAGVHLNGNGLSAGVDDPAEAQARVERGETVHLCATVKSNIKKSKTTSAQFNTK